MILSKTVRQIVSYRTVGDELSNELTLLQKSGFKVKDVTETEVTPIPGMSTQGFIIIYESEDVK